MLDLSLGLSYKHLRAEGQATLTCSVIKARATNGINLVKEDQACLL